MVFLISKNVKEPLILFYIIFEIQSNELKCNCSTYDDNLSLPDALLNNLKNLFHQDIIYVS